jgi:hypothetical protein
MEKTQKKIGLDSLDRTEDITIEEVRSLETFADWNDEKLLELINVLETFSVVVYNNWSKGKKIGREIALNSDNLIEVKIAA